MQYFINHGLLLTFSMLKSFKISFLLVLLSLVFNQTFIKAQVTPKKERPIAADNGKFFYEDDIKYLYGGKQANMHFDLSNCDLMDRQFHYGIGREAFPALVKPAFIDVNTAKTTFESTDKFLLVSYKGETKAYSVKDLTRHELVNDKISGKPIMAAYCILADLGAIYERNMYGHTFTFALSGYTYWDEKVWDGMDGFIMWDRETESLWWPLIGEAVSGKMKGAKMKVMDESHWKQTTWKDITKNHKNAKVLKPNQIYLPPPPNSWNTIDYIDIKEDSPTQSIAPRWGENGEL